MGTTQSTPDSDIIWYHNQTMTGYKGFNHDMTCRGMLYEVGKTYEITQEDLSMCKAGFHFCRVPIDVDTYYPFGNDFLYAKIQAEGMVGESVNKCATSKITIPKMLTEDDLRAEMPSKLVRNDGNIELYEGGKLHNDNGPAITGPNGHQAYAQNGVKHRVGFPAETWDVPSEGYHHEDWYLYGLPHRIDGPATVIRDAKLGYYQEGYYIDGKQHRIDGPAVIYKDSTGFVYREEYWINGQLHREGVQPAIIQHKYILAQMWYKNDKPFREGGKPCIVLDCVHIYEQDGMLCPVVTNPQCNQEVLKHLMPGLQHPTPEFLRDNYQVPKLCCDETQQVRPCCDETQHLRSGVLIEIGSS
jgi:hypothetical protein